MIEDYLIFLQEQKPKLYYNEVFYITFSSDWHFPWIGSDHSEKVDQTDLLEFFAPTFGI